MHCKSGVIGSHLVSPRWTIPINIRLVDKPLLDEALKIVKADGTDITTVFRTALAEFVKSRNRSEGMRKMDEFVDDSRNFLSNRVYRQILTPDALAGWGESELIQNARVIRARKEEIDRELRRRGYHFRW